MLAPPSKRARFEGEDPYGNKGNALCYCQQIRMWYVADGMVPIILRQWPNPWRMVAGIFFDSLTFVGKLCRAKLDIFVEASFRDLFISVIFALPILTIMGGIQLDTFCTEVIPNCRSLSSYRLVRKGQSNLLYREQARTA